MKVTLHIEGPGETRSVEVTDELTVGRTPQAGLVLNDEGLSRVNTTIFIDGDEVLAADEGSTNGTFKNGERISGQPVVLRSGDRLTLGTHTTIRVDIDDGRAAAPPLEDERPGYASGLPIPQTAPIQAVSAIPHERRKPPWIMIAAGGMTVLIVVFAGLALLLASGTGGSGPDPVKTPPPNAGMRIPVRVIDPLGGEDEDDLDDLIASWETAEEEINAQNVADITVGATDSEEAELNVTAAFLADRQRKALEDRPGEKGIRPAGLEVPKELFGDGVIKQKAKLREMKAAGYHQPLDFADLADKRLNRELLEMPMATQSFYLDVGGSASDGPFRSFSFNEQPADILVGSPKYGILSRLAGNFAGHKYDLNNPADRKQMRMRLLRMFNPNAKPILKELADAYFQQFNRPLRVTSLTRSMDYQILLNAGNANSFKVRDEHSLPPHTSGCAFDLARKHMPAEEQNFVMQKLAEMEQQGRLDALIEYGANACFSVFIYYDLATPKI